MIIYMCTNRINGKRYIGQTRQQLNRRIRGHYRSNDTSYFHNALKKYDVDNFEWEILCECSSREELDEMEYYYIKHHNTLWEHGGYNLRKGGHTPNLSESSKKKISQTRIREGTAKGEKNPMYGKSHSEETRKLFSEQRKGNSNGNKTYIVTNPDGEKIIVEGLKRFCREHGLIYSSVHTYMKRGKPYKGYFVKEIL